MARPEKPIDWERVDWLLQCGCTGVEIAANYDLHPDTFYRKVTEKYKIGFTDYCAQKKQSGDILLREAQFEKALEKDNTMMIWLGKQRLGQKENVNELKGLVVSELRAGLRQISQESGSEAISEPDLAAESHLPDSGS